MTNKRRSFKKGIILSPDTTALTEEGGVKYDDSAKKVQYRDDSGTKSVVSEDGTQTLENKTIDGTSATGNNTVTADADNISYDNSTSGLTATDVKAAIDEVQSNIEGKDEASEISYDNTTSGLTATNVQTAIDEVDGDLDTHIADTSAHGTTGNVVGTSDSQTLTNKTIDADSNTISNIDNADIKAGAAIDATKIADGSVTNTEFQYIGGLTSDAQTQIDNKLSGIGASNDNRIIRNDGTTGNSLQESGVTIDDSDVVSGITQLNVDNIRVDGNTISSTDTNGNVELSPDGTGITKVNSDHQVTGNVINDVSSDSATGSNATLTAPSTKNIRLTDGSLSSIDMIPAGTDGQEIVLINATGAQISINDSTGATAANQIKTGTQAAIQLSDEASIPLVYDATEAKWMVAAGVGGSNTVSDKSVYAQYDAENQDITGFTNISITTSSPINETASYSVDSFTASLPSVSINDRSKNRENNVTIQYTMTSGTAKFVVKDNSSNTLIEQEIEASSEVSTINIPYFVSSSVTSIQLEIQDVSSATGLKIDDIIFTDDPFVYANLLNQTEWEEYTPTTQGFGTISDIDLEWKREGSDILIRGRFTAGTTTGDEAQIGLPNSETIGGNITVGHHVGTYMRGASGAAHGGAVIATKGDTFLNISSNGVFGNASVNALTPTAGSSAIGTGELISIFARVPIEGWSTTAEHVITPIRSNSQYLKHEGQIAFGSTANKILRVNSANSSRSFGSGVLLFTDSVTDGSSWEALDDCFVDFSYIYRVGGSSQLYGLSINASSLTTGITSLSNDETISWQEHPHASQSGATLSASFYMKKGDVIRIHSDGVASNPYNNGNNVNIVATKANATFLAAVPVQQTCVAYDSTGDNTTSRNITAGSWVTINMNSFDGDPIVSISSNQITLDPGKYEYDGGISFYVTGGSGARLRDVTNNVTYAYGENNANSSNGAVFIPLKTVFTITETTIFEVQARSTNNGLLGNGGNDFGEVNTFNPQTIRKIR